MAIDVFHVLTEFRFEIGEALVNTSTLKGAVDNVSRAADSALLNFQKLSMGIVGYMGLGTGSVLGLLQASMQASDKFGQSQRQLANIFLSNNLFQGADGFEQAMLNSAAVMDTIKKKAQEFALPAGEMVQFTKLIGASLISHGLDDSSLKKSTDISRGFLKSAPTLGIDPTLAQGQLLDAVLGRANLGDTLFQRLMNETQSMSQFKGNPKAFNNLPDAKRVKVLTDALLQFGSNAKILEGNARSLTGEFQRLKDSVYGMFSILRPIGDLINNFILPTFHQLNNYLQKEGAAVFKNLAKLFDGLIESPKNLLVNLMQVRSLSKDLENSGSLAGFLGILLLVASAFRFFGGSLSNLGFIATFVSSAVSSLSASFAIIFGWLTKGAMLLTGTSSGFAALFAIVSGLTTVLSSILLPLALILTAFQLIRRAIAIAYVDDMIAIANAMPKFTGALAYLKSVLGVILEPFVRLFNAIAQGISPIFRFSYYFDGLIWLIERLADTFLLAMASFQGVVFVILHLIEQLKGAIGMGGSSPFASIGEAFNAGIDDMIQSTMAKLDSKEGGVVNSVTNIGKVEIQNSFKEQMEPDRIAFTLKEQLLKTAQNPNAGTGRSLSSRGV